MKKLFVLTALVFLTACTTKTEFGDCVGIADDKNPNLKYKVSAWNLVVGIVFMELIAPPVLVISGSLYCPVGKK